MDVDKGRGRRGGGRGGSKGRGQSGRGGREYLEENDQAKGPILLDYYYPPTHEDTFQTSGNQHEERQ